MMGRKNHENDEKVEVGETNIKTNKMNELK